MEKGRRETGTDLDGFPTLPLSDLGSSSSAILPRRTWLISPPSTFKLYISLQVNKLCRQVPTNCAGPPSPWAAKEMNLEFYVFTWRASQRSSPEGLGWVAGGYTIV